MIFLPSVQHNQLTWQIVTFNFHFYFQFYFEMKIGQSMLHVEVATIWQRISARSCNILFSCNLLISQFFLFNQIFFSKRCTAHNVQVWVWVQYVIVIFSRFAVFWGGYSFVAYKCIFYDRYAIFCFAYEIKAFPSSHILHSLERGTSPWKMAYPLWKTVYPPKIL